MAAARSEKRRGRSVGAGTDATGHVLVFAKNDDDREGQN